MFIKTTVAMLLVLSGLVKADEDPILDPNPNNTRGVVVVRPASPTNIK